MKFSVNRLLIVLFSVIVTGIIAVSFVAHKNSQAVLAISKQIESTNKILGEAEMVLTLDDENESATRGYILTGDATFIQEITSTRQAILYHTDKLRVSVKDSPTQEQKIKSLVAELLQKNRFFDQAIILRDAKGTEAAARFISDIEGKQLNSNIGQIISNIELAEADFLKEQQEACTAKVSGLNHIFMLLAAASIMLVAISLFVILHALAERKKRENEIRELNITLEQRVVERTKELRERELQLEILNASLDSKVKERTQQLEETNKELESFSYSVSHDLRAPLRVMHGYGKLLLKRNGDKFEASEKELVETIITTAKQMGQLIDDLLDFSRLGRTSIDRNPVDMNQLAQTVIEEVKRADPENEITVNLHDLQPTNADHSLIKQVWTNLVSNAVKYSRKREKPTVEIGTLGQNGQPTYYVKDNGAGFDMAHYDKLFAVFQRLHRVSEYEGTGVGLALVQRIITKHGGKIWAESKVNEGATFYFTLPANS